MIYILWLIYISIINSFPLQISCDKINYLNKKYSHKLNTPIPCGTRRLMDNDYEILPNKYIVSFLENSNITDYDPIKEQDLVISELEKENKKTGLKSGVYANIENVYNEALKGFAAYLNENALEKLLKLNSIQEIEPDRKLGIKFDQKNPIWNLDRIDQTSSKLNNRFNTGVLNGENVDIYIIDTGINPNHEEFIGRVGVSKDFVGDGRGWIDCNGHGTHCAGTAMGTRWGVAKKATVHALRVLGCDGQGSFSGIISAIDWLIKREKDSYNSIGSLSLGGGKSNTLNLAVDNAVRNGITMVVAAGNENTDACQKSPASSANAITVGSTQRGDLRSSFSNYGNCVDIFAPGSQIQSASYLSNSGSTILSGTSMATPHVAGAIALEIQLYQNSLSPNDLYQSLLRKSTKNIIQDVRSKNIFLRTSFKNNNNPIEPPRSRCETISGGNIGKPCKFPFRYKGTLYNGCISKDDRDLKLWCSTMVDENQNHITGRSEWGHCNNECPIHTPIQLPTKLPTPLPKKECQTINTQKQCIFPFIYKNNKYNKCINIDDINNKYWCSTRVDNEGRHISGINEWGYCNSKCPLLESTSTPIKQPTKIPTFYPTSLPTVIPTLTPTPQPSISCKSKTSSFFTTICQDNCPGPNCDYKICECGTPAPTPINLCTTISIFKNKENDPRRLRDIQLGNENSKCIFPFKYKNKIYNGCTKDYDNKDKFWCSTRVDSFGNHISGVNEWGYCSLKCPIETQNINCFAKEYQRFDSFCKSQCPGIFCDDIICICESPGTTRKSCMANLKKGGTKPCVFPFYYNNIRYTGCITDDYKTQWCPTQNYESNNIDLSKDEWGECSSGCFIDSTLSIPSFPNNTFIIHTSNDISDNTTNKSINEIPLILIIIIIVMVVGFIICLVRYLQLVLNTIVS